MTTEVLGGLSNGLVYSAIAVYVLALVAYATDTAVRSSNRVRRHDAALAIAASSDPDTTTNTGAQTAGAPDPKVMSRWAAIGTSLTVLGFLLSAAALLARALAGGRAPWGNMYEFVLSMVVAAAGSYLLLLLWRPIVVFGVWIVSLILLGLGMAITVLYTPVSALIPVLNSYWLVIHVAAAIISGGLFTVGFVAAGLYLLRNRAERRSTASSHSKLRYSDLLPEARTLEQITHIAHMIAFPIWTFAVLAGAIWAENSWGRYWGWDPKETWAFITWVLYAASLHAQATAGWRSRAAWFAILGYAAYIFNFFGVNMWIPGLHSYAGI